MRVDELIKSLTEKLNSGEIRGDWEVELLVSDYWYDDEPIRLYGFMDDDFVVDKPHECVTLTSSGW